MYTKEQAAKLRRQFWTSFGQYMKPVPAAGETKVNWLNYKTGIRQLYFRMDADRNHAYIGLEIRHADAAERSRYFEQFVALTSLLHSTTGMAWNQEQEAVDEHGMLYARIYQQQPRLNVLNESDWPAIIAFLKPRIVALDAFWEMVKDGFEG